MRSQQRQQKKKMEDYDEKQKNINQITCSV